MGSIFRTKVCMLSILALLFFSSFLSSAIYSQEAKDAQSTINQAEEAVSLMQQRDIPVNRVNETLQEAKQIFEAQHNLEIQGREAKYSLITDRTSEVIELKEHALKAQDELAIFLETYNSVSKSTNLSAMDSEYNAVIKSFEEERFEDTSGLIEKAYEKMSEVEASQTALKVFYKATTTGLKSFLVENWKRLISKEFYTSLYFWIVMVIVGLYVSGNAISRLRLNLKLKHLLREKEAIKQLMKDTQYNYFKDGTVSELEYNIKINKFGEMIRDIDRQIPLIKEDMMKLGRGKKEIKKEKINPEEPPKDYTNKQQKPLKKLSSNKKKGFFNKLFWGSYKKQKSKSVAVPENSKTKVFTRSVKHLKKVKKGIKSNNKTNKKKVYKKDNYSKSKKKK